MPHPQPPARLAGMAVLLGAAIALLGPAGAAGAADAGLTADRVRFACSLVSAAGAEDAAGTAKFCDLARTALRDLAAGRLEEPVTRVSAWAATLDPDAEAECRRIAGLNAPVSCDRALFRLVHKAEPLPVVPVDFAKAPIAEPGAVTAIIKAHAAADAAFGARTLRVSLKIIAVADTPQRDVELFQSDRAIGIEHATGAGDSLRVGLQLLWADYFTPNVVNHIIGNALAAKARRATPPR